MRASARRRSSTDFDAPGYHRNAVHRGTAQFIAALAGKGKAEPTGEDGLIALALADAAVKSVAEGRVVKMSEVL